MSKVKITETVLRDSHQSLIATRMTTEEMLPILSQMDQIGYHSLEAWGGATFDSCMRFLNEDPWERLRKIRAEVKNTKLQMLFRGQNILGYRHYSDDVVEYFVQISYVIGGKSYRVEGNVGRQGYKLGEEIWVYFNPDDPHEATQELPKGGMIFAIVGGIVWGIGELFLTVLLLSCIPL